MVWQKWSSLAAFPLAFPVLEVEQCPQIVAIKG